MIVTIRCFLCMLGCASACNIYSDNELVRYSLSKNSGQVVRDLSGNNYHGLNGGSLRSEEYDVVWTDRGGYFNENQHISLEKSIVSENQLLLSQNFTLVIWVYPISNAAYLFGSKNYLKLTYLGDSITYTYRNSKKEILMTENFKSIYYSDKWGMFSLIFTYFPTYALLRLAYNENVYAEDTVSKTWEDSSDYPHLIGKKSANLKGFIYEFTIYDEPLLPSVFSSDDLFVSSSPCAGYPASSSQCISEVEDPLNNYNDESCQCNQKSCRSGPNDCIECECELNCSTSSPYSCIDFEIEFCCPFAFDTSLLVCDYSSCCEGFFFDEASSACSASCPSGLFGNASTRRCEECDSRCLECEGTASYCLSCKALNSSPSKGTCGCSRGFFTISSSPLQCCPETCKSCDEDLSCLDCIQNASLEDGNCTCNSGFFLNSDSECEECGRYCVECEEAGCLECESKMIVENKECVCEGEMKEDECLGFFSISAELKDNSWIQLKSDEKTSLTKDQVRLELRSYNYTVAFEITSQDSLTFRIDFEIFSNFLEGEYFLDLIFDQNSISSQRNILQSHNYSFPLQFSIDRTYTSQETAGVYGLLSAIFTNFVAMISLNEPTALWTIARTAQYISYLPLLDLSISDSLYRFLRSYNTAIFIPNFGVELLEKTDIAAPDRFRTYGLLNREFEDTNIVRNGSRFFVLFAGIVLMNVLACAVSYVFPWNFFKKKRDMLRRKMIGCLIRLWILLGLDFLIYSSVTMFGEKSNLISDLTAVVIFGVGNSIPLMFYSFIRKNEELLRSKDEKTMNYFDSLFVGIEVSSKFGIFYEVLMALRSVVFAYSVYWMFEDPMKFCAIQLIVCCLFLLFVLCTRLFETKLFLVTNILSEVCLCVLFIGLIIIEKLESKEEREIIEYTIKGTSVGFIIFGTLAGIVWSLIKSCREKRKKKAEKRKSYEEKNIAVGQIRQLDKQNYDRNSFLQEPSYFFEPSRDSSISIIHQSRDNIE